MSFMKMLNKRGPRIDTWGTPSSNLHLSLKLLFIFNLWNRSDKLVWINLIALKEKPHAFILASNKLWLSVSNALDRFIYIFQSY